MAYIQFLSEKLHSKEEILIGIVKVALRIENIDSIFIKRNKEIEIVKVYFDDGLKVTENIWGLSDCLNIYNEYLKNNEIERFVYNDLIDGKCLIPLLSADKVRCKRLVFELAKEYLTIHTENYLLIDQTELYDLERVLKTLEEFNL